MVGEVQNPAEINFPVDSPTYIRTQLVRILDDAEEMRADI
jgi:hypothetical protein